jgi:biopolymer transport protein ExbD
MFLCLDISDVDEFILHDIMKACHSKTKIPVILTYTDKSSEMIKVCKTLRYQPEEYLKKPVSDDVVLQRIGLVLKQKPQTPILVRGDKDADYGSVTTAMVLLQSAGVEKVGLMTEQP